MTQPLVLILLKVPVCQRIIIATIKRNERKLKNAARFAGAALDDDYDVVY